MADLDFDTAIQLLHTHSHNPSTAQDAITFLGQSSQKSAESRERLQSPQITSSLLTLLCASLSGPSPTPSTEPTLRCLGNASVGTNEQSRQLITDHGFSWVGKCFAPSQQDKRLKAMAFNALYNICHENPAAQQRCFEEGVQEDVLACYFSLYGDPGRTDVTECDQYPDLLLSMCEKRKQGGEGQGLRADVSRERLLELPLNLRRKMHGGEDVATVVEVALIYLRDVGEQGRFIEQGLVGKVWEVLEGVEDEIVHESGQDGDEENVKLLVPLATSLVWVLSDLAAHEKFAVHYADRSEFIHRQVFGAIEQAGSGASKDPRLLSAACQILGNLLWSVKDKDPSTYNIHVLDENLYEGLQKSATRFQDAETLYSVVGLLIHLCRHSEDYRAKLSRDEQLAPTLKRLCESESKEVRQGSMKLLQLLGKNDPAVREQFADLAKQVMDSLVAEQSQSQSQQNGSIVEVPD